MPRQSAEELGAAAFRAGVNGPKPPEHISESAAKVWRKLVASKPADWFDDGAEILLENFCEIAVEIRFLHDDHEAMREADPHDDELRKLEKRISLLSDKLCTLATKLRLTVQARVAWEDRRTTEKRQPEAANDKLLGGTAVWQDEPRRAN